MDEINPVVLEKSLVIDKKSISLAPSSVFFAYQYADADHYPSFQWSVLLQIEGYQLRHR